ncbi:MAG: FCD domain-containing protein, partial [Myxococcales bacterium]|nr:FCD domain-containing protein [Myxococcales bacterium]
SGLRVNDPAECGDISLVPQWLEVTLDQPTRAAGILADLLEMRRALAGRLLLRHRVAILARLPALQQAAQRVRRAQGDPDAVRDADLAFSRELLRAAGNVVALSVFNTVARVLVELPLVSAAMYAAPEENVASMAQVLGALAGGGEDAGAVIEGAIAAIDARTVARFEASLQARRGEAGPAAAQGLSVGVRA